MNNHLQDIPQKDSNKTLLMGLYFILIFLVIVVLCLLCKLYNLKNQLKNFTPDINLPNKTTTGENEPPLERGKGAIPVKDEQGNVVLNQGSLKTTIIDNNKEKSYDIIVDNPEKLDIGEYGDIYIAREKMCKITDISVKITFDTSNNKRYQYKIEFGDTNTYPALLIMHFHDGGGIYYFGTNWKDSLSNSGKRSVTTPVFGCAIRRIAY